jgi:predicted nuclease of predicted toxin-antitoxin system
VKFLVDNNLSPLLAESLTAEGHDAINLRDLGMQAATDEVVLARAAAENRVSISADTDFGGLLARSRAASPSVLLIRRPAGRRAVEQSAIIQATLTR